MARKHRFYLKDIPCHIVQRGNNRQACFISADDFGYYMHCMEQALARYAVQLHAFVLMTNHVHLLMTPQDSDGISRVMQSVGRDYVRYFNKQYQRTGTLFEGRHKSSLIDSERYFLQCQRYIELNPVRAHMVEHPALYHWSSYQHYGVGKQIGCLTPHNLYLGLGQNHETRMQAYQSFICTDLQSEELAVMRQCFSHNYPLGSSQFRIEMEHLLGRRFGKCNPGRPEKGVGAN
jgi:putative transposase